MNICVYCGSRLGVNSNYQEVAAAVGKHIVQNGHTLVYGGGSLGLMGVLANSVVHHGGTLIGIIPTLLATEEVLFEHCSELYVVADMHTRKRMLLEKSDAVFVLPGGLGTLDEFFEAVTWNQLGIQQHPIVLLNVDGYFLPLIDLLRHCKQQGFLDISERHNLHIVDSVHEAFAIVTSDV
jgi:uncharacterized protein (TIGR00730 family)